MGRFLVGLIIGLLVGAVGCYAVFIGMPRRGEVPGTPIQPPDQQAIQAGTAQLIVRQELVNEALNSIFHQMNPPTFPLSGMAAQGNDQCPSQITILPEGSGVQTAVRFENDKLIAPLAFTGSDNSMFGCMKFSGWAQSDLEFKFDRNTQTVYGQLNVENVNLDGVNPVFMGLITPIVQSTLNARVNPIRIMDAKQMAIDLPVAASNGNLKATVSGVRAEVKDNALNLYLVYDFGSSSAPSQP